MYLLSNAILYPIKHISQLSHAHTLTAGMAPEHWVCWRVSPAAWVLVLQDEEEEVDEDVAGAAVGIDVHAAVCSAADSLCSALSQTEQTEMSEFNSSLKAYVLHLYRLISISGVWTKW